MALPNLRDKWVETALVAIPAGVWIKALQEFVTDLNDGKAWLMLERFAWAGVVTWLAWLTLRYLKLLDEAGNNAEAAERYARLRASLAAGGGGNAVYNWVLTRLLAAVDQFYGDASQHSAGWQRRLFVGLHATSPVWTSPSYERCLQIALIYPFGVLYLCWLLAGTSDPLAPALGLKPQQPAWVRAGFTVLLAWPPLLLRWKREKNAPPGVLKSMTIGAACMPTVLAVSLLSSGVAFVGILAGVATVAAFGASVGLTALFGVLLISFIPEGVWAYSYAFVVGPALMMIARWSDGRNRPAAINAGTSLFVLAAALCLRMLIATRLDWPQFGVFLLLTGLFTVLSAPFDWLSLGLTRGLLRRGLETGGAVPWLLALLDAALATLLIIALAASMVLGVQVFDAFAVRGGGAPVLPLQPLFEGLRQRPADPEFWWLHALLLSKLLPSIANLAIGGFSLLRGWPKLGRWLLRRLPALPGQHGAEVKDRYLVAGVLTAQWALGAALGIAAQALLAWALLGGVLPRVGHSLLDLMEALAAPNFPARWIIG